MDIFTPLRSKRKKLSAARIQEVRRGQGNIREQISLPSDAAKVAYLEMVFAVAISGDMPDVDDAAQVLVTVNKTVANLESDIARMVQNCQEIADFSALPNTGFSPDVAARPTKEERQQSDFVSRIKHGVPLREFNAANAEVRESARRLGRSF